MAEIFISYARADREKARLLADYLLANGRTVWWDADLVAGSVFSDEIKRRIDEALHVIVIWSETSVRSHFVRDEAGYARDQSKLRPIRIDSCSLPFGFGQLHTHDVHTWPGDLNAVLKAVSGEEMTPDWSKYPAWGNNVMGPAEFLGGNRAFRQGDYEQAITHYEKSIRLKPNDADVHHNLGLAYHAKGDLDRAITAYDQAVFLKPNDTQTLHMRGIAHHQKGEYDRAIADYDRALAIDPNHPFAANNKRLALKAKAKAAKRWF